MTADQRNAIRTWARLIWLRAWTGDGRVVVPEGESSLLTALVVAAVTDVAVEHRTRIDWVEYPGGWVGEMTPAARS